MITDFDFSGNLQPDLSGALFVNFCGGKSLGKFAKKRERKAEIAAIKKIYNCYSTKSKAAQIKLCQSIIIPLKALTK